MTSERYTTTLDQLVDLRAETIASGKDPDLPYVGLEHLAEGEPVLLGTAPSTSSTSTNALFFPGDILFGKLRPNLRKTLRVDFAGYCSTEILVLRPRPSVCAEYVA